MMYRLALVSVLVLVSVATAAPIPKSLKKRQYGGDPNGVWQLTKFNSSGREGGHESMAKYWEIDGEHFFIGIPSPDNRGTTTGNDFKITNPDDPDFRMYAGNRSRLKVNGDELCWVYASMNDDLTECSPGPNRFYYEFKRVK